MRKALLVLIVAVLASCAPVVLDSGDGLYIYDSAWNRIDPATLVAPASRAINARAVEVPTVLEAVEAYNATITDDQLFVYAEPVAAAEAPEATGFICDSVTLEVYFQKTVPRIELETNREAWRVTTEIMSDPITGERLDCTLYVDRVPPEPIDPPPPPPPKLCLALVDWTDLVIFASETCATEEEAAIRYTFAYMPQRDLNILADGHDWKVYWGTIPFAFDPPEIIE